MWPFYTKNKSSAQQISCCSPKENGCLILELVITPEFTLHDLQAATNIHIYEIYVSALNFSPQISYRIEKRTHVCTRNLKKPFTNMNWSIDDMILVQMSATYRRTFPPLHPKATFASLSRTRERLIQWKAKNTIRTLVSSNTKDDPFGVTTVHVKICPFHMFVLSSVKYLVAQCWLNLHNSE